MSDSGLSAGEAGGIFAGVLSALGVFGAGVAWLAGWFERRSTSREGKLQRWHDELEEREQHIDEGRTAYTRSLEGRIASQDAEIALLRHRMNNSDAMWDSVILLLEMAPERVGEIVATLKAKRAEQKLEEAAEKGAVRGARGAAGATMDDPHPGD